MNEPLKYVGVIGLGGMGAAMAHRLVDAGFDVTVWNRSAGPVEELGLAGAAVAPDLLGFSQCDVVVSVLADDRAVREVLLCEDFLGSAKVGSVHVNMATISPPLADELQTAFTQRGLSYVSAPVFGRTDVAAAGELTVLAAGDADSIAKIQPILDVIGRRTWSIGEKASDSNLIKVLGNYMLACTIGTMAEVTTVADAAGVDPMILVEVLTETMFSGTVHRSYGQMIGKREYGPVRFRLELGLKDVQLALSAGLENRVPMVIGTSLQNVFIDALAHGQAADDWVALAETVRRRAGLPRVDNEDPTSPV